jgi:hypothetical protein
VANENDEPTGELHRTHDFAEINVICPNAWVLNNCYLAFFLRNAQTNEQTLA